MSDEANYRAVPLFSQGQLKIRDYLAPNIVLRTKRHNIWNTHPLLCPRNLLISTSPGHPIIKTNETGYLMCFWDALGLADICQQDNHQHGQHFNMKPYDLQNLWLSWTYGRPDLMVVLILWLSWSYGCPHLMIVRILWLSDTPVDTVGVPLNEAFLHSKIVILD